VISTKGFFPVSDDPTVNTLGIPNAKPNTRGSRKHLFDAVDASLQRLQTSYIDLYIILRWDKDTPIEETMEALHDIVKSGKVRYIGASSMYAWQFAKAQHVAKMNGWTSFVSMQNLYNLLYREEEREMIPMCLDQGVGLTPWSPLARGKLTVKEGETASVRSSSDLALKRYFSEDEIDDRIIARLREVASKKNVSPAQIAIAWLLSKPSVTPVIGATKESNIDELVQAIPIKLTPEEIKFLEEQYRPKAVVGNL